MRFVPLKSVAQQDIQVLHRIRSGLVKERTALANRIRRLLGEYGMVVTAGLVKLRRRLPALLEDAENGLTAMARHLFAELQGQFIAVDKRVASKQRSEPTVGGCARHLADYSDGIAGFIRGRQGLQFRPASGGMVRVGA